MWRRHDVYELKIREEVTMNRDLKGRWQNLRSELQHWSRCSSDDLEWIDAAHDYACGRVAVQHGPRTHASEWRSHSSRDDRRR